MVGQYSEINSPSAASVIDKLSEKYGMPDELSQVTEDYDDSLFGEFPHPLLPTIGIEIELPHRALDPRLDSMMPRGKKYTELPDEQKVHADEIFIDIEQIWSPRVSDLKAAGLIIGNDSFAEIIFPPCYSSSELGQLTSYMYQVGLIPRGAELPLHLTLGGLNVHGEPLQLQRLARIIELLDGSTNHRIYEPLMGGMQQWSQKNPSGYLVRGKIELAGGYENGIELRALSARSPDQLKKVLWRAQWLGACLKAWIEASDPERQDAVGKVPFAEYERGLMIDSWKNLSTFFNDLYELNGVSLNESWGGPKNNTQFWTRHFVMCSSSLGNDPAKRKLCEITDSVLTEVRYATERHYMGRLFTARSLDGV